MQDLSLHVLDIVENSIDAGAKNVEISIREDRERDVLTIEIADDGCGMNEAVLEKAADPFWTTRETRRVGLGLSLFEQAAQMAGGTLKIDSQPEVGTRVTASFQSSHIDRKPLGKLTNTLLTLIVAHSDVEFSYSYEGDESKVSMNTKEIKARLGSIQISSSEGISLLRKELANMRTKASA
jgi:DNA mismatch repair ATPase MutL